MSFKIKKFYYLSFLIGKFKSLILFLFEIGLMIIQASQIKEYLIRIKNKKKSQIYNKIQLFKNS